LDDLPLETPEEASDDPVQAALEAQLDRLERSASVRRSQDLPIHAVMAGWKGECDAWMAEIQREVRVVGGSLTLPLFGWFADEATGWWSDHGQAVDPTTVDLSQDAAAQEWVAEAMATVEPLTLSELPFPAELTDLSMRTGLATVRDAVHAAAEASLQALRHQVMLGLVEASQAALVAWYENRGAAGLAVVDEIRRHIEYAAARRHFLGRIAPAIEEATRQWAVQPRQPNEVLSRLAPAMESLARAMAPSLREVGAATETEEE
jgi:hypothetical protein